MIRDGHLAQFRAATALSGRDYGALKGTAGTQAVYR